MQSTLNVVVVNEENIELLNDSLNTTTTVGDLKRRLNDDPLCVDLLTKHRNTKEWVLLLSSEDCSLISILETIAHPRRDGALHFKAQFRAVWRIQAFIGLFADPFVVRLLANFIQITACACVDIMLCESFIRTHVVAKLAHRFLFAVQT
jgi:hypothetical protein